MDKSGLGIGVVGGIGLGLLLGSEYSGSYITLLGAALVVIFLVSMGIVAFKGKKSKEIIPSRLFSMYYF